MKKTDDFSTFSGKSSVEGSSSEQEEERGVGSKRKRVQFGGDFGTKIIHRGGQASPSEPAQLTQNNQIEMDREEAEDAPSDEDRSVPARKGGGMETDASIGAINDVSHSKNNNDMDIEDNEDEDDGEDDQFVEEDYDDFKYIMTPSYTDAELEQIYPKFQKALTEELSKIEHDPYQAFVSYKKDLKERQQQQEGKMSESLQRAIDEALIRGDPRDYQRQLTEIAKQQNTIIHLGTGAGKTLIALLCIRHFSGDFVKREKQTLFIVPSVALAIQQSTTLRANLPEFNVRTACYTNTNTEVAREELRNADIIVATHGAIYDLLRHYGDMFQMSRFNLVVIDECHYAIGNHPYALVMTKFYHTLPKNERPRILGLTASPLVNVKETHSDDQLRAMLTSLEDLLDAKLFSISMVVPEDGDQPIELSKSAEERVILFKTTNTGKAIPSAENLPLHQSRFREFRQLNQLYQDLGPLALSIYCKVLVRELSINSFEQESPTQFSQALDHLEHIANFCDRECALLPSNERTDKLLALEELLDEQVEEQGGAETVGLVFVDRRITAMALYAYFLHRDKSIAKNAWVRATSARNDLEKTIQKVVAPPSIPESGPEDQFGDADDDPFQIFSDQQTYSARASIVPEVDEPSNAKKSRKNSVRAAVLVRHPTRIFKSLSRGTHPSGDRLEQSSWMHTETKSRDVLAKLRSKESNVLIATSVVEEGVDVQACSFVVAFDSLKTSKGYIQMKGRARQKNAKFFVFQDHSVTGKSALLLSTAQQMERRVQAFIDNQSRHLKQGLGTTQDISTMESTEDPTSIEINALMVGSYSVEFATVDLPSAKSLLNRYVLAVPMDPTLRLLRDSLITRLPIYQANKLILPAHLPQSVRVVHLPVQYCDRPRKEKQRMLALMACVRLHNYGLLNNRLLPLSKRDLSELISSVESDRRAPSILARLPSDDYSSACSGGRKIFVHTISVSSPSLDRWRKCFGSEGHHLSLVTFQPIKASIPSMQFAHPELGKVTVSLGTHTELLCNQGQLDLLEATFILLMNDRWRRKSKNMFFKLHQHGDYNDVISPYLVGIANRAGELDWEFMKQLHLESCRTKEDRTSAVVNTAADRKLPKARIWTGLYDENIPYIAYGPSGESCMAEFPNPKEGIETYFDYFRKERNFDVSCDSPLFEVQRLWHRPNNLPLSSDHNDDEVSLPVEKARGSESKHSVCRELPSVKLAQGASCEAVLANVDVALLCTFLPQVLFLVERRLRIDSFVDHCKNNFPVLAECLLNDLSHEDIGLALTAKSCGLDFSYEKLEWLGDAVLKLVQTDSIIHSSKLQELVPYLHEGDLSSIREAMGSNRRLESTCKILQFDKFVMVDALGRGKWLPCFITCSEGTQVSVEQVRTGKVFADVIESLLGIIYIRSGYEKTLQVANELTLILPWEKKTNTCTRRNMDVNVANSDMVAGIARFTGYSSFNEAALAAEAFTHPSAFHPSVPSYQRLEWIGDAVICLATREWIFNNLASACLGDMVGIEAALVSNETLAYISLKNKLPHHMNHRDQSLPSRIENYSWCIRKMQRGLWGVDPPKAISDIVESVIGAVHTDGGFEQGQMAAVKVLGPILSVISQSSDFSRVQHPKKLLQELSGEFLGVSASSESEFAMSNPTTQAWFGHNWGTANRDGSSYLGCIHLLGSTVLALAEPSSTVSRNRVCALAVAALAKDVNLRNMLDQCRARAERGVSRSDSSAEEGEESEGVKE